MEQVFLLVTAGGGPMECRLAVGHVLARMRQEAEALGVDVSCTTDDKAPASALVALAGAGSRLLAADWIGTVQWRQASQLRPGHRRANWFVGVFALPSPSRVLKKSAARSSFLSAQASAFGFGTFDAGELRA